MSKSLADNPFITEAKDKNGDSWYHQIILEKKEEEIKRLNNIIKELEEDIKVGFYEYESNDSDYIEGYNDGAEKTSEYFINRIKELKEGIYE